MSARLFAVLGALLIGGAVVNEVTNVPITLSQYTLVAVVGLGGLCIATFLVLTQGDSIWAVPGPPRGDVTVNVEDRGGSLYSLAQEPPGDASSMETSHPPVLTELGHLVLRLSATGLLTDEVAEQLGMDPDEIRRHLAIAMAAIGARSKLEAVVLALRAGLIDLT